MNPRSTDCEADALTVSRRYWSINRTKRFLKVLLGNAYNVNGFLVDFSPKDNFTTASMPRFVESS